MYRSLIQEYSGHLGNGRTVKDILNCVEDVPPIPEVRAQALKLIDNLGTTPEELAEVLIHDPALASAILRAANSAGLAQQREVTTLTMSVLVVGMSQIKTMLIASALRHGSSNFGPVETKVWEKSIGAAVAARVLCEHLKQSCRDELYLLGLLHNLGQMVMLSHKEIADIYPRVLDRIRDNKEDYVAAEREIIGFSHPLLGALVARKWGFPLSTCQTILNYHQAVDDLHDVKDEKWALLQLATEIGLAADLGRPDGYSPDMDELNKLGVIIGCDESTVEADIQLVVDQTKARFATDVAMFA